MATFVLVHGGWAGGWSWKFVTPALRAAGHDVYPLTLTGLGERAHLLSPSIDLHTHIRDVTATIEYEDLNNVILVGHSYGCAVVAGVLGAMPRRLARVIYIDAGVPEAGQCCADMLGPAVRDFILTRTDIEFSEPPTAAQLARISSRHPSDPPHEGIVWSASKMTKQPLATMRTPLPVGDLHAETVPRTFIHCTQSAASGGTAEKLRALDGWRVRALDADHLPMATCPDKLAAVLLEEAR